MTCFVFITSALLRACGEVVEEGLKSSGKVTCVSNENRHMVKVGLCQLLGAFKLNVDATLNGDKGRYKAGMVIRNDKGKIVITTTLSFKGKVSVGIVEAEAVLEGILMVEKFGIIPLCIELDVLPRWALLGFVMVWMVWLVRVMILIMSFVMWLL
ncbi:hypothetical protein Q3G72_025717 [Acer saccharum]|nr:hypothetical protein Q3G72_025717 [Acer saccharum]